MKIKPLTLIAFVLLAVSCRKEKVVTTIKEVPKVHSWSFDSSFSSYNKILLTSLPLNDSILMVANGVFIAYVNVNQLNKSFYGGIINGSANYGYLIPPRLTKNIGVTLLDSNRMKVFSVTSPVDDNGSFTYTPSYSNSVYSVKGFPLPLIPNAGYPIIDSKYLLSPVEIDYQTNKAYLDLLQISVIADPNRTSPFDNLHLTHNAVNLITTKKLVLTPESSTIGFADGTYFSASYFDKFFIYYADQFYRIDTLGNIKSFGYSPILGATNGRVDQMFIIDNNLFTIGLAKIFISQDQGETWSLFSDILGTPYGSLNYFNVGNDLYATSQSQIWRVTISGSNLNFQELDNDGLQTSQITSINKVGKYAFVTTLSGLYYRDTASFNMPKK